MLYANTIKYKPLQDFIALTCPTISLPVPGGVFHWLGKGGQWCGSTEDGEVEGLRVLWAGDKIIWLLFFC